MDLTDDQFEKKYESELEILRDSSFYKDDYEGVGPFHVNDLELLNTYVIDRFLTKYRKKKNEKYYWCIARDKATKRKFQLWSNYALGQEIEKFKESSLAKTHKIHFWITKKRKSKVGDSIVAEINIRYHPIEKISTPPPIKQEISSESNYESVKVSPPPCPCGRDYTDRGFSHNCAFDGFFKKGRK